MDRRKVPVRLVDQPPRRFCTAYVFFVKDNYQRFKRDLGAKKSAEVIRALGQEWRSMGLKERAPYKNRELADRQRYDAAKADWLSQHGRIPPKVQRGKSKDASEHSQNPKDASVRSRNPKHKEETKHRKASKSKRSRRGGQRGL